MRLDRHRRAEPDPTLYWRVTLLFLGAGLWVSGVIYTVEWLTLTAIGVLAVAVVLRFLGRRRGPPPDDPTDPDDRHDPPAPAA